jgi:hypothetical protein
VVIVAFSFAIARWINRYAERYVVLSGAEYLLVGALLGPLVPPRLLTQQALDALQPFVSLLMGLLGFLVGLRGPLALRGGPGSTVGVLSSVFVLASVAGAMLLGLDLLGVAAPEEAKAVAWTVFRGFGVVVEVHTYDAHLWLSLAVGASAVVAASGVIQRTRDQLGGKGPTGELLTTLADTSQWVAVIALGVVLAVARGTTATGALGTDLTTWAVAASLLGASCGLLFSMFIGRESDPQRVFLAGVGAVIFASGIGAALGVSPLFVNWIVGVTVALTSAHAEAVAQAMERVQHPLFVLIMIFAGAMWEPVHGALWLLPGIYLLSRVLSRALFVPLFARALLTVPRVRLSNALWSQGTLAVAVAINFSQRYPELSRIALSTVLIGVLASELFSHRLLRAVLVDSGESSDEPYVLGRER